MGSSSNRMENDEARRGSRAGPLAGVLPCSEIDRN